jgi:hypothetical protein
MQSEVVHTAGYAYDTNEEVASPATMRELEQLKDTITMDAEDTRSLRMAGDVLQSQTDSIINAWFGVISATPHLACFFKDGNGKTDDAFKAGIKEQCKQWISDVCFRSYDQEWLKTHLKTGLFILPKQEAAQNGKQRQEIPLRYIIAFAAAINDTIKPFLARKGHSLSVIEKMHKAWCKAVMLHVALWSRGYCEEGRW